MLSSNENTKFKKIVSIQILIFSFRDQSVPPSIGASPTKANPKINFSSDTNTPNLEQNRRRGHLRMASGPPFARKPNREGWDLIKKESYLNSSLAPWSTMDEQQKRQQIELIDKEIDVMAEKTLVGIGQWRPKWIQRFATKNWMLLWLCWFCTIQGIIVNGLVPSTISTIERRFQLSTSTIGRIMQFYDFGYVLFCIPVSYFGGRHSKPLALAIGLLLMSVGCFMFSAPHLIADSYTNTYNDDDAGLSRCYAASNSDNDTSPTSGPQTFEALQACPSPENQPGVFRYVFFFCLAHFLHGIGATPLFTIGVSYIDENVRIL